MLLFFSFLLLCGSSYRHICVAAVNETVHACYLKFDRTEFGNRVYVACIDFCSEVVAVAAQHVDCGNSDSVVVSAGEVAALIQLDSECEIVCAVGRNHVLGAGCALAALGCYVAVGVSFAVYDSIVVKGEREFSRP